MRLFQGLIRFSPPKREPDSENYVVEYTDKNIFEGAVGQIALELLGGLVVAYRKVIEDFENGRETYYEIARPVKSKTKCGKSCHLCKIQLRHAEGGIHRGTDQSSA